MLHDLLSALVDLLTWVQRGFVDFGSVKIFGTYWSAIIYVAGLLSLPFAAYRQARAARWELALLLALLEIYFIHNRLTLFADVHLTRASLLGNVALLLLGAYYLLPNTLWESRAARRRARRKEKAC